MVRPNPGRVPRDARTLPDASPGRPPLGAGHHALPHAARRARGRGPSTAERPWRVLPAGDPGSDAAGGALPCMCRSGIAPECRAHYCSHLKSVAVATGKAAASVRPGEVYWPVRSLAIHVADVNEQPRRCRTMLPHHSAFGLHEQRHYRRRCGCCRSRRGRSRSRPHSACVARALKARVVDANSSRR